MNQLTKELLTQQNECTLSWVKDDGTPASTVVSFVTLDEQLWMTALVHTGRVRAIKRRPNVCVTVSGKGTSLGHSRCVSLQGVCEISTEESVRNRFFPAFGKAVLPSSDKGAAMMASMMNSPENAVLIFTPTKIIPYDAHDMLESANSM